jgi:hypothetical protein
MFAVSLMTCLIIRHGTYIISQIVDIIPSLDLEGNYVDKQKIIELIDSNAEKAEDVISEKIKIWAEYELFSALWWMSVVLTLLPWVIWLLVRPKESTDRLL